MAPDLGAPWGRIATPALGSLQLALTSAMASASGSSLDGPAGMPPSATTGFPSGLYLWRPVGLAHAVELAVAERG
jgi:hypothetical protein